MVISPTLPGLADSLANSPFWSHLPPVRNRQIYQVDPVWTFGGLYPVKRLALLLTDALLAGGSLLIASGVLPPSVPWMMITTIAAALGGQAPERGMDGLLQAGL